LVFRNGARTTVTVGELAKAGDVMKVNVEP